MAIASFMVPLGTPAPDFTLPSVEGGTVSLADFTGSPALLVVFLSNHCPYVRRIENGIGALTAEYKDKSLATVAICSNDVVNYPDDDAEHLREQVKRAGFTFPYLIDESQETAKAYRAACTPDFFLFDGDRRLVYHGAIDDNRDDRAVTRHYLREALDAVLEGREPPVADTPAVGCTVKYRS
jgi:peroxiredoxin